MTNAASKLHEYKQLNKILGDLSRGCDGVIDAGLARPFSRELYDFFTTMADDRVRKELTSQLNFDLGNLLVRRK